MARFEGKTVIVTGGARGMGASHARGFHAEGASVVIADVLSQEGEALARELGARALFVALDVREETQWQATVAAGEDWFGPIDVLINNAGVQGFETIEGSDPIAWRTVIEVNLVGQYLGIRAVIPSMRRAGGGAILNVSSAGAFMGAATASAYIASKWGIRGLTKSAALELGHEGIRVNSVHPGYTRTPMTEAELETHPSETYAIRRVADPADITELVLFVASSDASFSTGSEFSADGGLLLGPAMPAPSSP